AAPRMGRLSTVTRLVDGTVSMPAEDPTTTTTPPSADSGRVDDSLARRLRGFGPLWLLSFLLILLGTALFNGLGALLVLLWARASRTPWADLGFVRPRSWWRTTLGGIGLGVAFKLVMKSLVMPLFGAPPINQAYHYL